MQQEQRDLFLDACNIFCENLRVHEHNSLRILNASEVFKYAIIKRNNFNVISTSSPPPALRVLDNYIYRDISKFLAFNEIEGVKIDARRIWDNPDRRVVQQGRYLSYYEENDDYQVCRGHINKINIIYTHSTNSLIFEIPRCKNLAINGSNFCGTHFRIGDRRLVVTTERIFTVFKSAFLNLYPTSYVNFRNLNWEGLVSQLNEDNESLIENTSPIAADAIISVPPPLTESQLLDIERLLRYTNVYLETFSAQEQEMTTTEEQIDEKNEQSENIKELIEIEKEVDEELKKMNTEEERMDFCIKTILESEDKIRQHYESINALYFESFWVWIKISTKEIEIFKENEKMVKTINECNYKIDDILYKIAPPLPESENPCVSCMVKKAIYVATGCGHLVYCEKCYNSGVKNSSRTMVFNACPTCRKPLANSGFLKVLF